VAGGGCLIVGGLMLVESPTGFARVSLGVLIPVAAATAAITIFLVRGIVRAHRGKSQVGGEAVVGTAAKAQGDFRSEDGQYRGTVRVHGELWQARSDRPVAARQDCRVQSRDGLLLTVEPRDSPTPNAKGE